MKKTNKSPYKQLYSEADLKMFASKLSAHIHPGHIITLDGPLGSGKTTFTQALCQALQVTETVTSPSFGLINEYTTGEYPIAHLDLYRLGPEKAHQIWDELNLYLEEERHIILIEWASYGDSLPINLYDEACFSLHFDYDDSHPNSRIITIQSPLALNEFL